jgi:hypothetical protein
VRNEAVFPPGSLLTVQIILYLSFFGLLFFSERMLALFKIANSACKPLKSLCLAPSSFMGSFGPRVWSEQIIGQNFNTLEKSTAAWFAGVFLRRWRSLHALTASQRSRKLLDEHGGPARL